MTGKWPLRDALDWRRQFGLSVGFAAVLGLSLAVPIEVCTVGGFGDLSGLLRTTWTLATGSATLVSFALAVRKYRSEATESAEPTADDEAADSHTAIHVESVEGDVDLNVTLGDATKKERWFDATDGDDSDGDDSEADKRGTARRTDDSDDGDSEEKSGG